MTSAETMRRAAVLMRNRADVGSPRDFPAPWSASLDDHHLNTYEVQCHEDGSGLVADGLPRELAEHIASWDPNMARVVADLLDAGAEEFDRRAAKYGVDSLASANPIAQALVAIATTYLNEEGS